MELLKTISKFALGIALCAWLVSRFDVAAIFDVLQIGQFSIYLGAFLCFGISRLFEGVRLYTLVPDRALSPFNTLRVVTISTFFNNFAASVVGDGYRSYEVQRVVGAWPKSLTVVLLDRLFGFVCLILLGGFCMLLVAPVWVDLLKVQVGDPAFWGWAGGAMLVLVPIAVFVVIRFGLVSKIIAGVIQARDVLLGLSLSAWTVAAISTLISQLILALMIYMLLASFQQPVTFVETLFSMLIVYLAAFVPISIGSLGVREGLLVVLLPLFGASAEAALAAALVSRAMMYAYAFAGGIWLLLKRPNIKPNGEETT